MDNFVFQNPTKIIFGRETIHEIGAVLKSVKSLKALVLYGKESVKKTGVLEKVISSLSQQHIEAVELGGVQANPTLGKVQEAIEYARRHGVDSILAVGGGSVIDSAKVIALGYFFKGDIWEAFEAQQQFDKALPVYVVLTLSATASEMNSGAVVTNESEGKKWAIAAGELTSPKVSIIDPTIQFTLPVRQTINCAVDTISHVLEYYFNGIKNVDIQDEISESIIRTVIKHTPVLLVEPDNYESRAQLAWCSTLALNGINAVGRFGGDFATHTIEHSLSALHPEIAHAEGLSILFPTWMSYVCKTDPNKFSRLTSKVFNAQIAENLELAESASMQLRAFFKSIGAPSTLQQVGVREKELPKIAQNATHRGEIGRLKRLTTKDVLKILELSYK